MRTSPASAPKGTVRVGAVGPPADTVHPPGPHWVAQPPLEASQVSVGLEQVSGPPPAQMPVSQVLPDVHASPSSQAVPLAAFLSPQPVAGWHSATRQGLVLPGHWTVA